jgi:NAD+ diphosphatase
MRAPHDILIIDAPHGPEIVVGSDVVPPDAVPVLVGHHDGVHVWAASVGTQISAPSGTAFVGARQLVGALNPESFGLFARARMLVEWERTHRYCGACGTPTAVLADEHAVECARCGLRSYPRISPAVIVAVTRGDEILLAQPVRAGRAMYTVLAGFVEAGESLERAVAREIAEEVGIIVGDLAYAGSQPWPFPHALMVGFTARYVAGEITPDPTEIVDAGWYTTGDLPELPPRGSIARALIDEFVRVHTRKPWVLGALAASRRWV